MHAFHLSSVQKKAKRTPRQDGVTAIELMMVVAIVGILIAIAAPNLRAFFINNRLTTATNEFMAALALARNEAIRRGAPVSIRRVSAAARDWTQGWEIFVDANRNGVRDFGEELVREAPALAASLTLFASQVVEAFVPFTPDGRIPLVLGDEPASSPPFATFIFCYDGVVRQGNVSRSRAVLLNSAGRARMGVDSNGDGQPEDAGGSQITSCTSP